jgi:hypothetical protein
VGTTKMERHIKIEWRPKLIMPKQVPNTSIPPNDPGAGICLFGVHARPLISGLSNPRRGELQRTFTTLPVQYIQLDKVELGDAARFYAIHYIDRSPAAITR